MYSFFPSVVEVTPEWFLHLPAEAFPVGRLTPVPDLPIKKHCGSTEHHFYESSLYYQ